MKKSITPAEIYERLDAIDKIYESHEVKEFCEQIGELPKKAKRSRNNEHVEYYNAACSFDTEASSFEYNGLKVATEYIWHLDINGLIIRGREWDEWLDVYDYITKFFGTGEHLKLIIYVQFLSYDFAFFRRHHKWRRVFALKNHEPLVAETAEGVEFRDSYKLAGTGLEVVGKNLIHYPVQKLVGDLDYNLMRHTKTPLTEKELAYCRNDVKVLVSFILDELAVNSNNITRIPLTRTGYMRRYLRGMCYGSFIKDEAERRKQYYAYRDLMNELTITPDEYAQLRRAFAGGFTHAASWRVGRVQEDVTSMDICSDYPSMMCSKYYPMSRATLIKSPTADQFRLSISKYCCIFDAAITNIRVKPGYENCLPVSKCEIPSTFKQIDADGNEITVENIWTEDNGKLIRAGKVYITMTEVDFDVYQEFYTWDDFAVADLRRYRRGYLPKPIVEGILKLYSDKTLLKGDDSKKQEYNIAKGLLNAGYGCCCQKVISDVFEYDIEENQWIAPPTTTEGRKARRKQLEAEIPEKIEDYDESKTRFLFYPWGVYITSWARWTLLKFGVWGGIEGTCGGAGDDFCYADTDSVKLRNYEKHKEFFAAYNEFIQNQIKDCLRHYNLPLELAAPKTKEGVEKPLGVFEIDGSYKKFKSIHAKTYLVQYHNNEVSMTVSGLDKEPALKYLLKSTGTEYHVEIDKKGVKHIIADGSTDALFDAFSFDMVIPAGHTGKLLHTHVDFQVDGLITDYLGNTAEFHELSCVNLSPVSYSANPDMDWIKYVLQEAIQYHEE